MKMSKSSFLIRQSLLNRPCRRHIAGSSSSRTSTSPQRQNLVAPVFMPAMATAKSFSEIPGPMALPMLRHSAHILPRIGSFHHAVGLGVLESLRDKYGDLVRLTKASRSRPTLYVFDPEIMREVYESRSTEPPRFDRSPLCQHRKNVGSNCPIHSDDTKAIWTGIRMLLQEGALLKNYEAAFDDIAADVTRRLGELRQEGASLNVELESEIYRWAIETIGMMIFGIRLGCLDGSAHAPNPENKNPEPGKGTCSLYNKSHEELTAAERLVRCSRDITRGSFLTRSEDTLKTESSTFNNALKTFDRHFSLTEHFLLKALYELNSDKLKPEQVLLDKLRPLERRILPVAADILLAGVDPLAHSALSMFYHLSLHAAQQQRAHDEVIWAEASKDAGAQHPELSYVAACTREAMRLHPITGGVVRRSKESLIVAGYEIPEGVDIVLAHSVTSKAEKQWGRANAFIPERWCSEGWQPLRASRAHPLASMPFGETCPATGVAGKMLTSLTARILEKYRLEWHGPLPKMTTDGVNKIQPPYYFVLQNAA
ncbi:hypothetical protein O3G_MSEX001383 [Manduca sexta]|uniref:Cytochrome P450 n=1 Tax=Manduca sexta TaxID=7130 RepID=A0A921YJX4_MANSE|nr:hypothetical protein O3G_MSEX001383 [Manduca sexta]KAG6440595.1 hypothetical protein O3G_MSEX001383 [Manduca sexta]